MHLYGLVIAQRKSVFALERARLCSRLSLNPSQLRFSGLDRPREEPPVVMPAPGLRVMMNIHAQLIIHEIQIYADDARPAHKPGVWTQACTLLMASACRNIDDIFSYCGKSSPTSAYIATILN